MGSGELRSIPLTPCDQHALSKIDKSTKHIRLFFNNCQKKQLEELKVAKGGRGVSEETGQRPLLWSVNLQCFLVFQLCACVSLTKKKKKTIKAREQ